jgi:3-oxoacyl-[acyl-carrier protein] reductase
MQLAGKTALITGGSRGIGRAIALSFAQEGADIVFCHLGDDEMAARTAAGIAALGRRAHQASVDLRDLNALASFVADATGRFGVPDILVNNAGGGIIRPFAEIDRAFYDAQIDLNFRAAIFATHAVYRGMIGRGSGRVINIASQLGLRGEADMVLYAAAKAGIIGFTRSLARDAAQHGVLVNAIAPGPIATERFLKVPQAKQDAVKAKLFVDRLGAPEDVAATALLLAGPGGNFYVGACLSPNGGDVFH